MNNRFSVVLNVVLVIAVIVLFILHFTTQPKEGGSATGPQDTVKQLSFEIPKNLHGARVLYINVDSLDTQYEAFTDLSKETSSTYKYKLTQYQNKGVELQQRYAALQEKVQMGTISIDDAAKEEAAINKDMDDLKRMETELQLMETNAMKKNQIITQEISKYFKSYAQDKGIDFILGYGGSSTVLYATDSLDVTAEIVTALNAEYRANKAVKK